MLLQLLRVSGCNHHLFGRAVSAFHRSLGVCLFSLLLGLPSPTYAQQALEYLSGNELLRDCQTLALIPGCIGYLEGIHDAFSGEGYFCLSQNVDGGQLKDVVVKFLTEAPEHRDGGAAGLAGIAMVRAWPCPKPPKK